MKLSVIVFLGVCVGVAVSEMCLDVGDCNHESCSGGGWTISCNFGTCTCDHADHTGTTCTSAGDCRGDCPGGNDQHCVDNRCRCLRN